MCTLRQEPCRFSGLLFNIKEQRPSGRVHHPMNTPSPNPIVAGRRLLTLVAEVHRRGYERLRVNVGMAPSGLYWRCSYYAAGTPQTAGPVPRYTTGNGLIIFDWADAQHDEPPALAEKFLARFPDLAAAAYGRDPAYAAWFADMLRLTHPDLLPITYADWELPTDVVSTVGAGRTLTLPLPPPPPSARHHD